MPPTLKLSLSTIQSFAAKQVQCSLGHLLVYVKTVLMTAAELLTGSRSTRATTAYGDSKVKDQQRRECGDCKV